VSLPVLEGESLILRALEASDALGEYPNWLNDPKVTRYNSHGEREYTAEMAKEYIASITNSSTAHVFAIVEKESRRHVGNISLQAISERNQNAELAILIGEPSVYGKGIGFEAAHLLLSYGFKTLKLHRIYCGTHGQNIGMQKLALKLGMQEEGRRREAILKLGEFADIIEYGILINEYKG